MEIVLLSLLVASVGLNLYFMFHFGKKGFEQIVNFINSANRENREELSTSIRALEEKFEKQLDKIREVVNEKLIFTVDKRIGESFKIVSAQLERVQTRLGEMQSLAEGVNDLKKILANVKTRGVWGEVQLKAILDNILTPQQYVENAEINKGSNQRVEFAVKIPSKDKEFILLPIDSKFPQEVFIRLEEAYERADKDDIQRLKKTLDLAINKFAEDISKKYIHPPLTTDFGIMFLPTESIYAEVLKIPGKLEEVQRRYRVIITGPTTLSALLLSLKIGFKTVAIERRADEVWKVLEGVKAEFEKFFELIQKLKKHVNTVSSTLDKTDKKAYSVIKKLESVERLPEE